MFMCERIMQTINHVILTIQILTNVPVIHESMEVLVQTKSMVIRVHVQLGGRVQTVIRVNLQYIFINVIGIIVIIVSSSSSLISCILIIYSISAPLIDIYLRKYSP